MEASVLNDLESRFAGRTKGPLATDLVTRILYSTDASPYKVIPAAVLKAAEIGDIHAAIDVCSLLGVPITARGAGTSLSGQCVGEGLQLDVSLLNRIEWIDPQRRVARVEPGVTWWQLNTAAKPYRLEFGPDPATRRQATAAGLIGSNAGGTHSIIYGAAVDKIHAVEVVLADGRAARLEQSKDGSVRTAGAPPSLAASLESIRESLSGRLGPQFTSLARRGSGYQLEHLCVDQPHLGKFMAGSEGTLALITAAELELDPLPEFRVLAVLGFDDMHEAVSTVPSLVETSPCAVELVSSSLLDIARRDPVHAPAVAGVPEDLGGFLFVEYQGETVDEAAAGFDRMDRALGTSAGRQVLGRYVEPRECGSMWSIREAGIGGLSAVASGPQLPQSFVEDAIVAVERLPPFIREFDLLFGKYQMEAIWFGHASTGLIHVRPFLDLTSKHDLDRLESLMAESVDLVKSWGGDLSGEHGDGLVRTYWNERFFGSEIYSKLRAVKGAFDPNNLLNPGKVVDGPHPLENLRFGTQYRRHEMPVSLDWSDQGGFSSATERCFGNGLCRKRLVGTMCPPAAVTGLEEHSTRARANLLRSVVSGDINFNDLASNEAREVMETCVMCKACKSECPARVDMARMKVEWMGMMRNREGSTPLQRTIANLRSLLAFGSRMPSFANRMLSSSWFKRRLGVAPERELPPIARRPLTHRISSGESEAALFADCFTTYQEPGLGEALHRIVDASGRRLALVDAGCCGRVMLSEGFIDKARKTAKRGAAVLRESTAPILFCEPSCMSAVTDDWQHLIGDVSDISARCFPAEDYVARVGATLHFRPGGRAVLHGHCHQKALWGTAGTEAALSLVRELDLEVLDAGCCGMAGAFGYQAERYELSKAMADRVLIPAVTKAHADTAILATGTSCRHQIADFGGRKAQHPIVFLAERLEERSG